MSDKNLTADEILNKAVANAIEDRKKIKDKMSDLEVETTNASNNNSGNFNKPHLDSARSFSKYIENLQRSNEQLIKAAESKRKNDEEEDYVFDPDQFYSGIEEEENEEEEEVDAKLE